jgi:hypothetical protein
MCPLYECCFSGVHPVALYHHTLQNMPAITTKLLLLLYFSQYSSAITGHLQVKSVAVLTAFWKDN